MSSPTTRDFTVHDALSDVVMTVEGTSLYVHRQYLAEWSGVWRKQFVEECPDDIMSTVTIEIDNHSLEEVTELLQCIYSTQKPISDDNVRFLLDFSIELDMPSMRMRCEDFLLAQQSSLQILVLAEKYELQNLFKQCVGYAKTLTLEDIDKDPEQKNISEKTLAKIYREKVTMMRNYANDLKQAESKLRKQNDQLLDQKDGMVNVFNSIGKIWDMPNKRCYKHMTEERFDFTCRDCNEKIQREVRRMCNDGQHVRRFFKINNSAS